MEHLNILYIFDLFGTFAFAISGALVGVKKDMDVYGMFVLAIATGAGGGTLRDVMISSNQPFILTDINYMIVILAATLFVFFLNSFVVKNKSMMVLNIADAIGLGVFTCIGCVAALNCNVQWYGVIFFGVMTATVGGMMRDILAGEVPFVLKKEVYASASIAGGILFLILNRYEVNQDINILLSALFVTFIRLISVYKNWNLPHLTGSAL